MTVILITCLPAATQKASSPPPQDARGPLPWLDVPSGWSQTVGDRGVAFVPHDLPARASLLLLVEGPVSSTVSLAADYEGALAELGTWKPAGKPVEQRLSGGWVVIQGVGVTRQNDFAFTALTAVARNGGVRTRFWVVADSDDTFNRYKAAVGNAIASVQDLPLTPAAGSAPGRAAAPRAADAGSRLDPGFGRGVSGVYVGLERGMSAGAGISQPRLTVSDYQEVDVFFPDGTYRRRLPIRGLGANLDWERSQQPALWGRWSRQGDQVVVQRGSSAARYTVRGDDLVSDRDRLWSKLPLSPNARLDGSFVREDYRDPSAPRLILRADGSYEDRGGFLRMIGSAWNLVVPDGAALVSRWTEAEAGRAMAGGSGTYTFDAFTLTLTDRDQRVWQINAYVPPGATLPRPQRLVINGRPLVREGSP